MIAGDDHPPAPARVIGAFFSQTTPGRDFEVILTDSHDRPDFRLALLDFRQRHPDGPAFSYDVVPGKGRAHNSNAGLRRARGGLVLFFADDFIAPPGLVAAHLAFHREHPEHTAVGVGAGLLNTSATPNFYQWYQSSGALFGAPMSPDMQEIPKDFFYIGNSSVKRTLVDECGPFDESFPYYCWDDYEMGLRLSQHGMQSTFIPGATAEHAHDLELSHRCKCVWELGYSARIHEVKYPKHAPVWQFRLRRTALAWHWRALRKRLKHALTGDPKHLKGYYTALLKRSFVQGYARARLEVR